MEGLLLSTSLFYLDTSRTSTQGGKEEANENFLPAIHGFHHIGDIVTVNTSLIDSFGSYGRLEK